MRIQSSFLLILLFLSCLASLSTASIFDFFYLVQQWPGSLCDTKRSCCYPTSGKPMAEFGIHGLWPNYNNGSYPSNCNKNSNFDFSKISDIVDRLQENWPTLACPNNNGSKFWEHEWGKHGTGSESVLDQHSYIQTALDLQKKVNLRQILQQAGIEPDGGYYNLTSIKNAIREGHGYMPRIHCNRDESGNGQMLEIYLCVDALGKEFIECPWIPRDGCPSRVEFPVF